jgi:hypothetical protein
MIGAGRLAIALGVASVAIARGGTAQPAIADSSVVLAGLVVAKESGIPVGYSVVSIPALGELGRERYTTAQGAFAFLGLPAGTYRLRAKHLGYSARDVDVQLTKGRTEVRVELTQIALRLAAVRVVARQECTNPGPPDTVLSPEFATLFEQVRQNAERLRLLVERYPYRYFVERTFFDQLRNGESRLVATDTVGFHSDHGWRYRPGQMISTVVGGRRREYVMNLPSLVDVVDSAFLANHCFRYAGTDTLSGETLLRVDFYAAKGLRGPDVDGAVYLDTTTLQIRGARVALTRPPSVFRGIQGMTATTIFDEVVPSIPIPAYVTGTKILRSRPGPQAPVSAAETQRLLEVQFLRDLPGTPPTSSAPPGGLGRL